MDYGPVVARFLTEVLITVRFALSGTGAGMRFRNSRSAAFKTRPDPRGERKSRSANIILFIGGRFESVTPVVAAIVAAEDEAGFVAPR